MDLPEGVIIGFGNPLLDITSTVEESFMEKYDLVVNGLVLAKEKHKPLFEELTTQETVTYTAGGACQNSMRVFQWLVGVPSRAIFVGCVGKDKFGETIAKRARAEGVLTMYQEVTEQPTGTCAILVKDKFRGLCANLGAAGCFSEDWLFDEGNICVLERARFCYATGFFVAVCPGIVLQIAIIVSENKHMFILNFSAIFVLELHTVVLDEIIGYTDLIICNKQEALTYAQVHDWDTKNVFEIGKKLRNGPKHNEKQQRMVLITDQFCPVLCFLSDERIIEYPVPQIDPTTIVDHIGCNDAFVGGFLSQLVQNMPIDYCIRMGIFASQQMTHVVGCQVDKMPSLKSCCI